MVWNKFTSISEEPAASIFKVEEHHNEEGRRRSSEMLENFYLTERRHVTSHMTISFTNKYVRMPLTLQCALKD
jgi:hypothetical protein